MTDKILSANDDEFRQPDLMLAVVTATIFGVSALLFPMMICGCHFHAIAVLPTLTPLFWSLWLLRSYKTPMGRFGSWIALLGACAWLWVGNEGNLKFVLMLGLSNACPAIQKTKQNKSEQDYPNCGLVEFWFW